MPADYRHFFGWGNTIRVVGEDIRFQLQGPTGKKVEIVLAKSDVGFLQDAVDESEGK